MNANSLGWKITKQGEYKVDLPPLSEDEEQLVLSVEENFKHLAQEGLLGTDVEETLAKELEKNAEVQNIFLDPDQKEYLGRYAKMHACGFAFLDELLKDLDIEEISIIGPKKPAYVFVRNQGWKKTNAYFDDEKTIMDIVNRMASSIGRRITLQNPRLDAMLPDGSRLHASLRPISEGEITIRKFRQMPFSPSEIVKSSVIDAKAMAYLSLIMQSDNSVIIAGNTASGKTTTLNALFCFVPKNERVLIVEETPEINIPHEQQVRLVANRELGVNLKDLVYDSLRMRPDRMIVGEVRNIEEVEALFDVLLGGQARGAYATFHAQSAIECIRRLRKFGIDDADMRSIDAIVIQKRMLAYDVKKRSLMETRRVVEINETENGTTPVFMMRDGKLEHKQNKCGLSSRLADSLGLNAKEFRTEMEMREKWIKSSGLGFDEFFNSTQKLFYRL